MILIFGEVIHNHHARNALKPLTFLSVSAFMWAAVAGYWKESISSNLG